MNSSARTILTRLATIRAGTLATGCASIAVLALALVGPAASATPTTTASSTSELQRALDQLVAAGVPGAVVLARQGNHTTLLASGYGNLKQKTRLRTSDRFRVGSITKTFVATLVLQLVGEGKLSLDDTVEQRLPGVIPNGKAITIRQLLNMTSGLFDYLNDGDTTVDDKLLAGELTYRWSPLELIAISNKHKPRFAPGTAWEYCSTCYVLLGLIVEKRTGHPLAAELKRRIFVPAGLKATSFDTEPQIGGAHAHGYELLGKPPLTDVSILSPSHGWAAGALVSNARRPRPLLPRALPRPAHQSRTRDADADHRAGGPRRQGLRVRPGAVQAADGLRHRLRTPRRHPRIPRRRVDQQGRQPPGRAAREHR